MRMARQYYTMTGRYVLTRSPTSFVGILLRNGYLFYLSRTEPLKTCIYTHGGWGSISEISPRGIAGHIGRELHGKLGDHTAVD